MSDRPPLRNMARVSFLIASCLLSSFLEERPVVFSLQSLVFVFASKFISITYIRSPSPTSSLCLEETKPRC